MSFEPGCLVSHQCERGIPLKACVSVLVGFIVVHISCLMKLMCRVAFVVTLPYTDTQRHLAVVISSDFLSESMHYIILAMSVPVDYVFDRYLWQSVNFSLPM